MLKKKLSQKPKPNQTTKNQPPFPNQTSYTLNIHKSKQNYVHTHTHRVFTYKECRTIKDVETKLPISLSGPWCTLSV